MKNNIYDLVISELIINNSIGNNSSGIGGAFLEVTANIPSNYVISGYNSNVIFTSIVHNIPSGYGVKANTHTLSFPATSSVSGSTNSIVGPATAVILAASGNTFVVTATITLEKTGSPDIILTAAYTIVAVDPMYYGIKAYSATPNTTSLQSMASTNNQFIMTTSTIGRFYIVVPTSKTLISLIDNNGNVTTVSDFSLITTGGLKYYQLNWDTQLSGVGNKTFTVNLS